MNHPSTAAVLDGCQCAECHPSEVAYLAGCKCDPCAFRRYRVRKRHKIRSYKGPVMVDAAVVRPKLIGWLQEGHSKAAIAQVTGVDEHAIRRVAAGNQGKLDRDRLAVLIRTSRADLLAGAPDTAYVAPLGCQRRIQALMRMGWSQKDLAQSTKDLRLLTDLCMGRRKHVRAATHRRIAALYDRISMTPGENAVIRKLAIRRGYAPPLAWDDIDDPAAVPIIAPPTLDDLRMEMWKQGATDRQIAKELGINPESNRAWRKRHGLDANYDRRPNLVVKPDQHPARRAMYDQGMSDRAIARSEGVTPDTIRYWRIANKLPSNCDSKTVAALGKEGDNRYALWQQGMGDKDIAAAVGRHPDVIRRWRSKHGLEPGNRRAG